MGEPLVDVALLYRKPRSTGNFSIEASFDRMLEVFPTESRFKLRKVVSSYLSNGLLPRLRACYEAWRARGQLNHVTGDVHFLTLALPGKRTILTIHDCGFLEALPPSLNRWFREAVWLKWPVKHCVAITTVSEATKAVVMRLTGCAAEKIFVIPTMIDGIYEPSLRAFNAQCPRILLIGLSTNKNFERQAAALAGINCTLHIVGKLEREHLALLEQHKLGFTHAHNLSKEEMYRAYVESDALLFASTLEGFGMPILEAQSVGRAVITSNCSSMPEVAGAGACLVNPFDVDSIRAGVKRVLEDVEFRQVLVDAGKVNAQRYRAEEIARQYERLYECVLAAQR